MDRRQLQRRIGRAGIWTGGVLLTLAIALALVLSISDWTFARHRIAALIAARVHRPVQIEGPITASLLSMRPQASMSGLAIGNPEWTEGDMARIERIDLQIDLRALLRGDMIFESLTIDRPVVALIRDGERANFDFADADASEAATDASNRDRSTPDAPAVRRLTLRGGRLSIDDRPRKLKFSGTVEADEHPNRRQQSFRLRGDGTLNDEPFALQFAGGPLVNLRMDEPYAFELDVSAGATHGSASGEFSEPFDFATIKALLNVGGENLAHLYNLTNLALPFTPPYRLKCEVETSRRRIAIGNLDGQVGKSDVSGAIDILLGKRPKLVARLHSKSFNLADLSPAIGKGVRKDASGDTLDSVAPGPLPPDKLFPAYEFKFDRLRSMDADVTLSADSVQSRRAPLEKVSFKLRLENSVLRLDPFLLTLPQGRLTGTVEIDARGDAARSDVDLRIAGVELDQFVGKKSAEAPLDGVLQARLTFVGTGNSVHDIVGSADGQLQAVVPHGEIRKAFAELTGINVASGLGLLLAKDQSRIAVRCGIASARVHRGNADITQLIFDTESILIKGDGVVVLDEETLDLNIEGHSKRFRIGRVRAPITIDGSLRRPSVGIDAGDTAKQIGAAAVLGTLVSPLTAALAFVDPGLTKDENCAALLADAERAQAVQPSS